MIGHLWTRPAGVRVQGRAFGARVQKVQKVQRVQRVVVAASPQIKKKGGRGYAASCVEGLCTLRSGAGKKSLGLTGRWRSGSKV